MAGTEEQGSDRTEEQRFGVHAAASAPFHGMPSRAIALRTTSIFRITAVNATLPGRLLAPTKRSKNARIAGLKRIAAREIGRAHV